MANPRTDRVSAHVLPQACPVPSPGPIRKSGLYATSGGCESRALDREPSTPGRGPASTWRRSGADGREERDLRRRFHSRDAPSGLIESHRSFRIGNTRRGRADSRFHDHGRNSRQVMQTFAAYNPVFHAARVTAPEICAQARRDGTIPPAGRLNGVVVTHGSSGAPAIASGARRLVIASQTRCAADRASVIRLPHGRTARSSCRGTDGAPAAAARRCRPDARRKNGPHASYWRTWTCSCSRTATIVAAAAPRMTWPKVMALMRNGPGGVEQGVPIGPPWNSMTPRTT